MAEGEEMIGGTGLIKCSKEDFEKLKKKVSAHYYKKIPSWN